jgi:chromosome segregation ATPase
VVKRLSRVPALALLGISAVLTAWADGQPAATGPATRRAGSNQGLFDPSYNPVAEARDNLKLCQEEFARATLELRNARDKLRDVRQQMQSLSGRIEVSPDVLRHAAVKLEDEQQSLELEQAAMSARQEAMEKAAATAAARAKQAAEEDPVARELAKVVDARETAWKQLRQAFARGLTTPQEVSAAEAALAEAKAKLAAQREQAVVAAGGDGLAALNRELTNLSISEQERQARLRFIKERLAKLAQALQLVDDLEAGQAAVVRLQRDADQWETSTRAARFELDRRQRE